MGDRGTSATDRTEPAARTGSAAGSVFFSLFSCIDVVQGLGKNIAEQGGKFSAGMHLAIGQDGNEVKSRATAESGTPAG
jgi:hypothetical protein